MLVACAALAGCGDPTEPQSNTSAESPSEAQPYVARSLAGFDVVVVVIDGLRADHVTPETTPLLMDFASGGHAPFLTQADEVAEAVRVFAAGLA